MITPTQNAIILSKINNRNHQDTIIDLLKDHHFDNQSTEDLCNFIQQLEQEINQAHDEGYQECLDEDDDEF